MDTIMKWLRSEPAAEEKIVSGPEHGVSGVRESCLAAIDDCKHPGDERVRLMILRAENAQSLWMVRSEIYQAVSRRHCESEARRRVNQLADLFQGLVPARLLTRI